MILVEKDAKIHSILPCPSSKRKKQVMSDVQVDERKKPCSSVTHATHFLFIMVIVAECVHYGLIGDVYENLSRKDTTLPVRIPHQGEKVDE